MILSKFPLAIAASAMLLVAACDPGAPNQSQNTRQGAMIGALGGAAAGALIGNDGTVRDRNRAALIGAALGAGVGGGIGNSLDRQAEELRRALRNDVGVSNNGTNLVVVLSQDLLFATNSTQIGAQSQNDLMIVARSLTNYPDSTINVIGHTDNVGSASFNQDLSERRAQSVAGVLRSGGVSPGRVRSIGAGLYQPIASNATAEGRQLNRRVEIIITPN
ncbi:OmpA family protein [Yoonia vestfoldensis]|jgi:outer membrane protein OmpA-like peptidoglycan-associated protein|uniref:OmpA family protein n=1 Tax=Yoonia vestfoldensis SKA53 TaxID=314232 RepID=A3V5G0_9RHOB|nr:OmpA family protein [Yoonia vestfoldensis]EAQ06878.1 OmpA family protein [Yoonia vestfoldensis SKA53]